MIFISKYIDDVGNIKNLYYKVSHNIINELQVEIVQKNVLDKLKDSVMIIRGISDIGSLNVSNLNITTDSFSVTSNEPCFSYIKLPEPAFGSVLECVTQNLSLMAQQECYKVQSYFDNIRITLIPTDISHDSVNIILNEIRSNGIYSHMYTLNFSFNENWSSGCTECSNGMMHLRQELNKMSEQLYICDKSGFNISGKIIEDLKVNDKIALKEQIKVLLKNSLELSRVSNFEINDLQI